MNFTQFKSQISDLQTLIVNNKNRCNRQRNDSESKYVDWFHLKLALYTPVARQYFA